ncbi:MAG: hypothetical protein ACREJC_04505, partial [Tepidisphaeraceae bacterium]
IKPLPTQALIVLRTLFNVAGSDQDRMFRFSPAAVRLCAGGTNYTPLGTLANGVLVNNRPDDFLLVNVADTDRGADLVFLVERENVFTDPTPPGKGVAEAPTIRDGVFLEVKRMARSDLSGRKIEPGPDEDPAVSVMRKTTLEIPKTPPALKTSAAPRPAPAGAAAPSSAAPIEVEKVELSSKLPTAVNVGAYDDGAEVKFPSGSAVVRDKKLTKLAIQLSGPIADLPKGDYPIDELSAPAGMKVVIVTGTPPTTRGADPWAWAQNLADFALIDSSGTAYKPSGAAAKVKHQQQDKLVAFFDSTTPVPSIERTAEARPTDIWLFFLVPDNTQLREFSYKGQKVRSIDLGVQ